MLFILDLIFENFKHRKREILTSDLHVRFVSFGDALLSCTSMSIDKQQKNKEIWGIFHSGGASYYQVLYEKYFVTFF